MATTTTTNYSFPIPQDDELVQDGAAAIRALGNAVDGKLTTIAGFGAETSLVPGQRVVGGTVTGILSGFSTLAFVVPGLTTVRSITVCNGAWNDLNATVELLTIAGATITVVALKMTATGAVGGWANHAVRVNYTAIGT